LKVLVYGATGSQASPVVWKLLEAGHKPYVFTRNPERAVAMREAGAEIVLGDLQDPDSLRTANAGMDAVALLIPAFIPNPMDAACLMGNAVAAARDAGVKLIVWNTSGPMIKERIGHPMYDMRHDMEAALRDGGVPYIIIQPSAYLENLLGPWTQPNIVSKDQLLYPVPDHMPLGWIATEDVAALQVAALQRPHLANTKFVESGVENLTGPELAAWMSQGLGRLVTYYAMPLEEFGAALDAALDAAFGPGAGEGGIAGYKFQQENADRIPMWTDMGPVLEQLPVRMTSVAEWAAKNRAAFDPAVEPTHV
jgi:uncharacterized protein YbjT (DUF2867 family)